MNVEPFDPQVRSDRHHERDRRQADKERLVHFSGGCVDREPELSAEGHVGNIDRDCSAQRRRQPGAGDEQGSGTLGYADHAAAKGYLDVRRGNTDNLRRRRIVSSDLLESKIAAERLACDVQFDVQSLDSQVRAANQIQRYYPSADEEFFVDGLVCIVERQRELAAEIDPAAGNGNRNVAADFPGQTEIRYQQQTVALGQADNSRSAGGDRQRNTVGRDSRDFLTGQRGSLLESKVAA